MSLSYVSHGVSQPGNARLEKLDQQGKLNNNTLFRVVNLLTNVETHVPGGAISRFLNENYFVREVGENKPGILEEIGPEKTAEQIAAGIIAEAEAKAAEIMAKAQEKTSKMKGGKAAKEVVPESEPPLEASTEQEGGQ